MTSSFLFVFVLRWYYFQKWVRLVEEWIFYWGCVCVASVVLYFCHINLRCLMCLRQLDV